MSIGAFDIETWSISLGFLMIFGVLGWIASLKKTDVSIVDSMWSIMFLIAAASYYFSASNPGSRATLVFILVALWAVRLAAHITWRSWGEEEDYRYQRIRENNQPNFAFKSVYLVFGLQAGLAWLISLPLLFAINSDAPLGIIDFLGVFLWLVGVIFESVGDYQLAVFKANPANAGRVLKTGLWRFTRHPNYFGDFCVWWGFYFLALPAGGWWSIISPLLMSLLLLKVSGVAMLEKDIAERRPEYAKYIAQTNAFFPGLPHSVASS